MHSGISSHRILHAALVACTAAFAIGVIFPGTSLEAIETAVCKVEVLVDGIPLTEYPARGTTYVEALKGREYALRLTNLTDRRIAIALAVDGLNSIDAKTTTASDASKWVLGPHGSATIEGWQISSTDARRFFFTNEERSYGAWLGNTDNFGVIEAVVFREREPRWVAGRWLGSRSGAAPAPAERSPSAESGKMSGESAGISDLAATGIGRRVDHRVQRVRLELEDQPAARLRLRYEYRKQLVHLGVLPSLTEEDSLARREAAHGFSDFSFAPDPFSRKR